MWTQKWLNAPLRQRAVSEFFAVAVLATILGGLGAVVIPAHWGSIWMDREFSGWVAPIANRIADGGTLYADGMHMPLPPASFLLMAALFDGEATWIDESAFVFFFQAATILILYAAASLYLRPPVPLLAALATTPIFLSLPKRMFYDSAAQLLVASIIFAIMLSSWTPRERRTEAHSRLDRPGAIALLGAGILMATLLLTKQSTALGAFAGGVGALLLFPQAMDPAIRLRRAALFVAATAAAFLLWLGPLSSEISIGGLVHDVYRTGSEPKGGFGRLAANLVGYAFGTVLNLAVYLALFAAAWACVGASGRTALHLDKTGMDDHIPAGGQGWLCVIAAIFATAVVSTPFSLSRIVDQELWLCFLAGALFFVAAAHGGRAQMKPRTSQAVHFVGIAFCIALPAAMTHSLSVSTFRWHYDNNPLVFVALAALIVPFVAVLESFWSQPRWRRVLMAALAFLIAVPWTLMTPQIQAARETSEPWGEIQHLAGARLAPKSAGMRELVTLVRDEISLQSDDTILLLPNDPNVESWFERPRPELSSAIIFTDQYLDSRVDGDFARLQAEPPKVIVIGPRNFWQEFSGHWNTNWGASRLISRVQDELVPSHFIKRREVPIWHNSTRRFDFMDVYVRKTKPPESRLSHQSSLSGSN